MGHPCYSTHSFIAGVSRDIGSSQSQEKRNNSHQKNENLKSNIRQIADTTWVVQLYAFDSYLLTRLKSFL